MGEQQNGNGIPGRRRAHPAPDSASGTARTSDTASGDTTSGDMASSRTASGGGAPNPVSAAAHPSDPAPHPTGTASPTANTRPYGMGGTPALEALLGAALREGRVDVEGERRAVAAFRAARDAGAHQARTRRRDDWQPRERCWGVRSVRATLSVVLASLTLGGAAFAAIGTAGSGPDRAGDRPARPQASASTETRPSAPYSSSDPRATAAPSDRPDTAQDTLAHCQAYEKVAAAGKAGKALGSTAWQRLVTDAGGEANVHDYCASRLAGQTTESRPTKPAKPDSAGTAGGNGQATSNPNAATNPNAGTNPNTEGKSNTGDKAKKK